MSEMPILCVTELELAFRQMPEATRLIVSSHLEDRAFIIRQYVHRNFDIEVLPGVEPTFWELK